MSFQEEKVSGNVSVSGGNAADDTSWLSRFLPANFFTDKVKENRKKIYGPILQQRTREKTLKRWIGERSWTVVTLSFDLKTKEFSFKLGCGIRLPISRSRLLDATGAGGPKVRITVGNEVLRLERLELQSVVQELESNK